MSPIFQIVNLQSGLVIPMSQKISFGRSESCDVRLVDKSISRKHADIERRKEDYFFIDLGTVNGSLVNGEGVQGEIVLKHGDKIEIGESSFEFRLVPPAALISEENTEKVFLVLDFFGKEEIESKVGAEEFLVMRVRGDKNNREFIENHHGKLISCEEGRVSAYWSEATLLNRFKALSAARTLVLGTRIFWTPYQKVEGLELSKVGVTIVLYQGNEIGQAIALLEETKIQRKAILASETFLIDWPDQPESIGVEGFVGVKELSEI